MSQCRYCKKESNGHPFCKECGKKYFNFIPEDEYVLSKSEPVKEDTLNKSTNINKNVNKPKQHILSNFTYRDPNNAKIKFLNQKSKFYSHEGSKKYECKNKIIVRSLGEKIIADFLIDNKIDFEYEKEIHYKVDIVTKHFVIPKEKTIHPDFFIKGPITYQGKRISNLFIEFWGMQEKEEYENYEEYKMIQNYLRIKEYKLKLYEALEYTLINLNNDDLNNFNTSFTYKIMNYKENQINF